MGVENHAFGDEEGGNCISLDWASFNSLAHHLAIRACKSAAALGFVKGTEMQSNLLYVTRFLIRW